MIRMKYYYFDENVVRIVFSLSLVMFFLSLMYVFDIFSINFSPRSGFMDKPEDYSLMLSSGNIFNQLFWPLLCSVILFCAIATNRINSGFIFLLFLCLFLFIFFSVFWSDFPGLTIKRAILQVIIFLTFSVGCFLMMQSGHFYSAITIFSAGLLSLELLFATVFFSFGYETTGAFAGIHVAKNEMGAVAAIFFGVSICLYKTYDIDEKLKYWNKLLTFGWGVVLVLSRSKSPIAYTLLLSIILIFNYGRFVYVYGFCVFLALFYLVVFPLICYLLSIDFLSIYSQLLPEGALTGRNEIWNILMPDVYSRALLGHGFGAYWGIGEVQSSLETEFGFFNILNSAHNGYIGLALEIGCIGLLIFLLNSSYLFYKYAPSSNSLGQYLICFSFLYNLTEQAFLRSYHVAWIALIIGFSVLLYEAIERKNSGSLEDAV